MRPRFKFAQLRWTCLVLVLSVSAAQAETLDVRFDSSGVIEAGDAVANLRLGVIHSPFQATGWNDGAGNQNTPFSIGDGRHGVFDLANYAAFDSNPSTSSIIEIDTDQFPELQFTEFRLRSGWTLRPFGSKPLLIRSQSTFRVDTLAKIDCSGEDGAPNGPVGLSPAGGGGHCGGFSGGRGGSNAGPALAGESAPGFAATAGGPGLSSGHGGGGGSGMANAFMNANPGRAVGGPGGTAGVAPSPPNYNFTNLASAAGGGGGAFVSGNSSGAGGGAGGGTILIYAGSTATIDGDILANGGNGGGHLTSPAGPGGGGGGGSILLFAGDLIHIIGKLATTGGLGGVTAFVPSSTDGGRGSVGRIWPIGRTGPATGDIDDYTTMVDFGAVAAKPNAVAISRLFDLEATRAQFSSITSDDDGSTVLEVATSAEPFSSASADWRPATSILELSGKRYARFRLTLTAATKVRSVKFVYTALPRENFDFGSCQRVGPVKGTGPGLGMGAMLLILAVLLAPILFAQKLKN